MPSRITDFRPSKPPNYPLFFASKPFFINLHHSHPSHFFCTRSVSLLTPFVSIADPLDWTPGEHGIHITFTHPTDHTRSYSATYLPHICPEQGWTKEETVLSAISKAGYKGKVKVGDRVWKRLHVKIYGSVKAEASWQDYVEWKQSMSENGKATE